MSEDTSEQKPSKLKLSSSLRQASDKSSTDETGLKPARSSSDAESGEELRVVEVKGTTLVVEAMAT